MTAPDAHLITQPDAELFASIDDRLGALSVDAPAAVRSELLALREGFASIGAAWAAVEFDPSATVSIPTETIIANRSAADGLNRYLADHCDLAQLEREQIDRIAEAVGTDDRGVAECLHGAFGDIVNIDSSDLTPELLTAPVCDTSLIALLSGERPGE